MNAGQWNPLSNDDSVQPAATQQGGGGEASPSSNVAFGGGIGPVVPSATASPQPEGTTAPGMNGQVSEGENAQSEPKSLEPSQTLIICRLNRRSNRHRCYSILMESRRRPSSSGLSRRFRRRWRFQECRIQGRDSPGEFPNLRRCSCHLLRVVRSLWKLRYRCQQH